MRSKTPFTFGNKLKKQMKNFRFKGNFHDLEDKISIENPLGVDRIETRESNNEPLNIAKISEDKKIRSDKRVFQNDRIYFDEGGQRIKDHIVYKDYVSFNLIKVFILDGIFYFMHKRLFWWEGIFVR